MSEDTEPLFARALGEDWTALHDRLRERYDLTAADDAVAIGTGTMAEVDAGTLALPGLAVLARSDAAVTRSGTDVPFEIRTVPFRDERGREALVLRRRFDFSAGEQVFEDALRWDPERERLLDFLGTDGRLVAALETSVADGALHLDLGDQWLWTGERYRRVPDALAVDGTVVDDHDDAADAFTVDATVSSPLGTALAFRGRFETDLEDAPAVDPTSAYVIGDRPLPGR